MTTFSRAELTQAVRDSLCELLSRTERNPKFGDEESLLVSGRLHSLGVIQLVSRLEEKYQLDLTRHGFNQYDFDSVSSVVALIERKMKELS